MVSLPSLYGSVGQVFSKQTIDYERIYCDRRCGVLLSLKLDKMVGKNNQTERTRKKVDLHYKNILSLFYVKLHYNLSSFLTWHCFEKILIFLNFKMRYKIRSNVSPDSSKSLNSITTALGTSTNKYISKPFRILFVH